MDNKKYLSTFNLTFIILAYACTINHITVGAQIGTENTLKSGLLAIVTGWIILSVIAVLSGGMGAKCRLTGHAIWNYVFGTKGANVLSVVVATCLVCWSFFDFWYVGSIIKNAMPNYPDIGFILGVSIVAVCAILGAIKGVTSLKWLTTASIPFALVIFIALLAAIVKDAGGIEAVNAYVPKEQMTFSASINLFIASIFPITGLWSDVTYEARSVKTVAIAMPIGLLMMACLDTVGLFGSAGMGCYGIIEISLQLGGALYVATNIFIIIAQANTVPSNTHVLATEFGDVFKISKTVFVIAQPVLAVIASIIIEYVADISLLSSWVSVVGCIFSPVFGITIAEFWIVEKGNLNLEKKPGEIYPTSFISLAVGVIAAIYFTYFNPVLPGTLTAIVVGLVLQIILRKLVTR